MFKRLKMYAELSVDDTMKVYELKGGYLKCPKEWILINLEEASDKEYAVVVECRNSLSYGEEHFGEPIPHFVYFTETKRMSDAPKGLSNTINHLCVRAWANFQQIIDNQVEPIDDPDRPGVQLNADEWMKAPIIGYFPVYEQGDPVYGPNYNPPYNAKIIRTTRRG